MENIETINIIDLDADPRIRSYDWWEVEQHIKGGQFTWDPQKVQVPLINDDKPVECSKNPKELSGLQVFNANLLDYLLDHPELIPEEWKKDEKGNASKIFFWGTIYKDLVYKRLFVRCLDFGTGQWERNLDWIDPNYGYLFGRAAIRVK